MLTDEEKLAIFDEYCEQDDEGELHLIDRVERAVMKKLGEQVNNMPVSEKLWPQEPQRECVVYEWPENEVN